MAELKELLPWDCWPIAMCPMVHIGNAFKKSQYTVVLNPLQELLSHSESYCALLYDEKLKRIQLSQQKSSHVLICIHRRWEVASTRGRNFPETMHHACVYQQMKRMWANMCLAHHINGTSPFRIWAERSCTGVLYITEPKRNQRTIFQKINLGNPNIEINTRVIG